MADEEQSGTTADLQVTQEDRWETDEETWKRRSAEETHKRLIVLCSSSLINLRVLAEQRAIAVSEKRELLRNYKDLRSRNKLTREVHQKFSHLCNLEERIRLYDVAIEFRRARLARTASTGSTPAPKTDEAPSQTATEADALPGPESTNATTTVSPPPPTAVAESANGVNAERSTARLSVVTPILERLKWTRSKWATKAGVGKNSVYEYLDGKRNLSVDNRKAMAEALGLNPEQLPA